MVYACLIKRKCLSWLNRQWQYLFLIVEVHTWCRVLALSSIARAWWMFVLAVAWGKVSSQPNWGENVSLFKQNSNALSTRAVKIIFQPQPVGFWMIWNLMGLSCPPVVQVGGGWIWLACNVWLLWNHRLVTFKSYFLHQHAHFVFSKFTLNFNNCLGTAVWRHFYVAQLFLCSAAFSTFNIVPVFAFVCHGNGLLLKRQPSK